MVVEHEDSFRANGDNNRVLQGVVDNLCHLNDESYDDDDDDGCDDDDDDDDDDDYDDDVYLIEHVALSPENFP